MVIYRYNAAMYALVTVQTIPTSRSFRHRHKDRPKGLGRFSGIALQCTRLPQGSKMQDTHEGSALNGHTRGT